jgi:hypothetical protein
MTKEAYVGTFTNTLLRCPSRPGAQTHRRAQPLQSEAAKAEKAPETAIPGVLRMRPAPTGSVLGRVRFSSAEDPPSRQQKPEVLHRLWLQQVLHHPV